jgi:hypothetical protein
MTEELNKVPGAILQEPTVIIVDVKPVNRMHKQLQKWKILPSKRKFSIYPTVPGSLIKISKLLLTINFDPESIKGGVNKYFEAGYHHMADHAESLAKIIAIAIVNRKRDPSQQLIDFILYNFNSQDLIGTLTIVLSKMDVKSFMNSIILVRAMNLLKMSPEDQGS